MGVRKVTEELTFESDTKESVGVQQEERSVPRGMRTHIGRRPSLCGWGL